MTRPSIWWAADGFGSVGPFASPQEAMISAGARVGGSTLVTIYAAPRPVFRVDIFDRVDEMFDAANADAAHADDPPSCSWPHHLLADLKRDLATVLHDWLAANGLYHPSPENGLSFTASGSMLQRLARMAGSDICRDVEQLREKVRAHER